MQNLQIVLYGEQSTLKKKKERFFGNPKPKNNDKLKKIWLGLKTGVENIIFSLK